MRKSTMSALVSSVVIALAGCKSTPTASTFTEVGFRETPGAANLLCLNALQYKDLNGDGHLDKVIIGDSRVLYFQGTEKGYLEAKVIGEFGEGEHPVDVSSFRDIVTIQTNKGARNYKVE